MLTMLLAATLSQAVDLPNLPAQASDEARAALAAARLALQNARP